ncbi:MAG: hypothetical protein V2B19_32590 [Pseudomonadota bacterium]
MKLIYDLIQQDPKFFTWVFGIINVLWVAFLYYNQKRHDRELKKLQHSLNLDLERRKRVFDLKVGQYERYVGMLDEFGRKYQTGLYIRVEPIFKQYMSIMLTASNEQLKATTLAKFSEQMLDVFNEISLEWIRLKAESKALKLSASDSLISLLKELESMVEGSKSSAENFIKKLPILIISKNTDEISRLQIELNNQSEGIQVKSKELEHQMRLDLKEF